MEGDEIGIVLGRASELRWKINNCIHNANARDDDDDDDNKEEEEDEAAAAEEEEIDPSHLPLDDESESLLHIHDALESLEQQLSSLQALQQQQRYEKEAILAEIDQSRKILLKKLKEYRGEDLEVIHEASAFASETVEHNDDLLLPPYPSRPPNPMILNKDYQSNVLSLQTLTQNGIKEGKKKMSESAEDQTQSPIKNSSKGLRHVIVAATKAAITTISVLSVLSLAGFEPRLKRRSTQFKIPDPFQNPTPEEKRTMFECPPGKVLVMENGEPRCLVKERVEIPFQSVVATPNVSYGCG